MLDIWQGKNEESEGKKQKIHTESKHKNVKFIIAIRRGSNASDTLFEYYFPI